MLINNSLYTYGINIEFDYIGDFVAGTALGLGIAGTALWLLNGGLNGCGLFGRNCGAATAAEIAVNSNEQYLERKECEDMVALIHSAINFWFEDEDAGSGKV